MVECFVIYLAGHNRPPHEVLFGNDKDIAGEYERAFVGMTEVDCSLETLLNARARLRRELPQRLSTAHRQFLSGLVRAEPDWSLVQCPARRSTAGTALEVEQSRNLPQAPSRRLCSASCRPRHRLGPALTTIPLRPTCRDCPMSHSSWHSRRSGPIPKGFRQRPKGWEGAKEGRQGERPYPEKAKRRPRAARHPGFAMLSLFQRKRVPPTAGTPPPPAIETAKGLLRPESAASLLATPRRQKLLEHIWQRTSLSRQQFATLYLAPLERYAELVQQFPASENHHHAYPGGMLDHGLEIVAYALKLRQSYLLPAGVTPEAQAAQAEAWTAGTAYAALLHDIGKIAVDLHVEHADGSVWHPWHGPLRKPYRFRYRKEREYRLHSAATGLLYARLLDRDIFDWLSGLSRSLGRAAVRAGRPVRARRHAWRTGRAGRPGIGRPGARR